MKDFFKVRSLSEEGGAGEDGTPSLVAKYKAATPGQSSVAPARQSARKGDKLNVKDEPKNQGISENREQIKQELTKIADRMHSIEKSGGRVPLTDPLHQKAKVLRAKLKTMKEETEEEDDTEAQRLEMLMTELYFICYAAEEIIDYLEMGGDIDGWYYSKLSKVHGEMEGLYSWMQGEKQKLGLDDDDDEDEDEMDESVTEATNDPWKQKYFGPGVEHPVRHKISVTVSDPNHSMVSKRTEKIEKKVNVKAKGGNKAAMELAKAHMQKKGYKVHDVNYVNEETTQVEESIKPYVSSTSPKLGEKGSHDVVDKSGKVIKSHPYTKGGMQMAQIHLKKLQKEEVEIDEAISEGENKQVKGGDPCWKGYQMVGMKKKGDRSVPNCVPKNEDTQLESDQAYAASKEKEKEKALTSKDKSTLDKVRSMMSKEKPASVKEESSYKVDVEGLPTMYVNSKSPSEVKMNLRKLLRKADSIKSVERVMDSDVKKASRLRAQGKEESVEEGMLKNVKRMIAGKDAKSRAGSEINKAVDARQDGDSSTASKHYDRYKKLTALTKKESVDEKLDPSQDAGEYVKDFQKSDAPQFKGKTKKERQKMAVAAYLGAKRGD